MFNNLQKGISKLSFQRLIPFFVYQKYKDSKADSLAQSFKKLNNEKDDFEKMWIQAGQAVYDKSGNLLPVCKKKN